MKYNWILENGKSNDVVVSILWYENNDGISFNLSYSLVSTTVGIILLFLLLLTNFYLYAIVLTKEVEFPIGTDDSEDHTFVRRSMPF